MPDPLVIDATPTLVRMTLGQQKKTASIIRTHIQNMTTEMTNAHGKDEKRYQFYWDAIHESEALLRVYEDDTPDNLEDDDEEEEEDGDTD